MMLKTIKHDTWHFLVYINFTIAWDTFLGYGYGGYKNLFKNMLLSISSIKNWILCYYFSNPNVIWDVTFQNIEIWTQLLVIALNCIYKICNNFVPKVIWLQTCIHMILIEPIMPKFIITNFFLMCYSKQNISETFWKLSNENMWWNWYTKNLVEQTLHCHSWFIQGCLHPRASNRATELSQNLTPVSL